MITRRNTFRLLLAPLLAPLACLLPKKAEAEPPSTFQQNFTREYLKSRSTYEAAKKGGYTPLKKEKESETPQVWYVSPGPDVEFQQWFSSGEYIIGLGQKPHRLWYQFLGLKRFGSRIFIKLGPSIENLMGVND